ncbi:MAG: potassium-transporting ATPase subunit KdpC [Gemmatimonadota bacterium]|nr:potassium-transporting ATPase subunit KdpC [Gemmatimonadota bacterium]
MSTMLRRQLRPALVLTIMLCVITGAIYPAIVTAIAQIVFPRQANGSMITENGRVIGSALLGQSFQSADYFHSRPSAAGIGYDATASGGTNKGPTDTKLADTLIAQAVDSVVASDGGVKGQIPSDMVTSSGSGLDPDISPANALLQVARVAKARSAPDSTVHALVDRHTKSRQLSVLGEPTVNVLSLNLALDSLLPRHHGANP